MARLKEEFGKALTEVMAQRGLSNRGLMYKTMGAIDQGTVNNMRHGMVPKPGVVIELAKALNEPINKWLELAGHDPIPAQLVREEGAPYGEGGRPWTLHAIPEHLLQQIREAPSRERRIELAFEYILSTGVLGLHRKGKDVEVEEEEATLGEKEYAVRAWQGITGQELLPE